MNSDTEKSGPIDLDSSLQAKYNIAWRDPRYTVYIDELGSELTFPECYKREVLHSRLIFEETHSVVNDDIPPDFYVLYVDMVIAGVTGNPAFKYIDLDRKQLMFEAETGSTDVTQDFYEGNMRHCLGFNTGDQRFRVVHALREPMPTDLRGCVGVVLSGSEANVKDEIYPERVEMTKKVSAFLRHLGDRGIPLLGICFGSQLLNQSLDAEVDWIRDLESGDKKIETGLILHTKTDAGRRPGSPIEHLPDQFYVHAHHSQEVLHESVPASLEVLAKSDTSHVQIVQSTNHAMLVLTIQNHIECGDTRADVLRDFEGVAGIPEKLFQAETNKARRVLFIHFLHTAGAYARQLMASNTTV